MKNSTKKFSSLHRGLHWTMAIVLSVLYITGFLRMYWMNKKSIVIAIETKLGAIENNTELYTQIAKSIQKPMWQWHEYSAYIIFTVLGIRIIYMLVKGIRFPNPFSSKNTLKQKMQGSVYVLFYLFVLISSLSGAYLKWFEGDWKEPIEMIHKWAVYWFPIFIFLHFVGIYLAEKYYTKGIASKMIGGDN